MLFVRRRRRHPISKQHELPIPTMTSAPSPPTTHDRDWALLFMSWLVATVSTLGSLFFSHVMGFAPCVLCWYQRICLFPLVLILAAGLFPFDRRVVRYALPLAIVGWLIAAYHNLIAAGVIPEALQPCSQGVSCSEEYIALFGFLTIPILSLLAFSLITALLTVLWRRLR